MVLSTPDKRIKYLSKAYHGSNHDYSILKTELPPEKGNWFTKNHVHVDLGYQGIDKKYICLNYQFLPKSQKEKLTKKQKKVNRKKSRLRVYVENAIGGMKRYRFLSDRLRCHSINLYNKVAGITAGL